MSSISISFTRTCIFVLAARPSSRIKLLSFSWLVNLRIEVLDNSKTVQNWGHLVVSKHLDEVVAEDLKPPGQQLDSFWGGFHHQDLKLGIGSPKTPIFCNLFALLFREAVKNVLADFVR